MLFTGCSIYFSGEITVCVFDKDSFFVSSSNSIISTGEVFSRITAKQEIVSLRNSLSEKVFHVIISRQTVDALRSAQNSRKIKWKGPFRLGLT